MRINLLVAVLLVTIQAPAHAQTFGPPIPGMCLLSRSGAIAASRAGQSMQSQLKQMQGALSGELARQRQMIEQQRRALEMRRNATAPIEFQRLQSALNQQEKLLDQQQNTRFIAAQTSGQQKIDAALNRALSTVITRAKCSAVFERDNAYGWNNEMDITSAAVRELDAILPSVVLP